MTHDEGVCVSVFSSCFFDSRQHLLASTPLHLVTASCFRNIPTKQLGAAVTPDEF